MIPSTPRQGLENPSKFPIAVHTLKQKIQQQREEEAK